MKKEKKHRKKFYFLNLCIMVLILIILVYGISFIIVPENNDSGNTVSVVSVRTSTDIQTEKETAQAYTEPVSETPAAEEEYEEYTDVYPEKNENSKRFSEDYKAEYALLMNADTNEVVAYRNANAKMYPASLAKIMTLIVAVENIEDLSDTVLITDDMVFPMIELEAARAGFLPGETPTLEDILYGMILNSGADAVMAVSEYVAGSEEAFVGLMNEKAEELGLKSTHFTNAVGLHDTENYSTATDMALILEYAIQNDICRKIISAYEYKVPPTEQNPEGLTFTSNFFSRMYGDEMPDVTIQGGKTGFTDKAGNCIESFAQINGNTYILVMCRCTDKWNAVYDTLSAYSVYGAGGEKYISSNSVN